MSKVNKYKYGYLPKINFWQERYDQAKSDNDISTMEYCLDMNLSILLNVKEMYMA